MTSNIAGEQIMKLTEEQDADWEIEAHVREVLRNYFKPEFLNRIDESIVFHTLSKDNLKQIVEIQITHLAQRLGERHITVEFTENAKKQLMDEGYDPSFGARPLKRTIQQRLENKLASELLEGKFAEGDTIKIDANAHNFNFEKVN